MSTTTPNRRAVATGVDAPELCNNPEHKWEIALSLVRDFNPRKVKVTKIITGGASAIETGDLEGPRQGFTWFVNRLTCSAQPLLAAGATSILPANGFNADVAFFESRKGAESQAIGTAQETPFGGAAPLIGYLQLSNLVSGAWGHIDFDELETSIDSGNYVGFLINMSSAQNGQIWVVNLEAVEVPNALVPMWLSGGI